MQWRPISCRLCATEDRCRGCEIADVTEGSEGDVRQGRRPSFPFLPEHVLCPNALLWASPHGTREPAIGRATVRGQPGPLGVELLF